MEDKPMFNWLNELFNSGKKSQSADIDISEIDDIEPVKNPISSSEFINRLQGGERRFNNLIVEGVDLRGLDLSHLVLANCELQDSDLSYACLFNANFSRSKCDRTNFTAAYLEGANFYKTSLVGANFSHCQAIHINLSRANLNYANLTWANLTAANLSAAQLEGANLSGANLENTNLDYNPTRVNIGLQMLRLPTGLQIIKKSPAS
ncbi:pentapeptide repeat-containing protein [Arthrospira platensis FACHB-971]|jgi:uncharacterized protein YjbI with pentapeptide repeats|nr:hypothetical protein AP285_07730 [Arthrospira platensis YZ]KDR54382.1 hypothetical protein APPUASWS_028060 [Arthrospira platensis str. Paraca]MBD2574056.1 pentapeptide repeat-containing protein [Arthrospira platensis FACHB-971]MBD2669387.1 pentapeptide repeat-containing protein [Arthrospira platensis FACHB-439]MBD2711007.1 pentapeptide repeat-containing protein [Arthrospira platensis FACHB-835]BAI89580.1 pentapeptide repeat-containing protein [Arthrospira platensis NIES-39]